MSANRKLLGEIQQVLKKVEEGVEIFDEIWGKVYAAEQQTLKEKYESDLKKEIKKLQRLRDQIKTWLSSNEIKDKTQLTEARKTIESKMELFKVCEKDTKTKAYSKEGLAREAKLDPKEALKEEKRNWLNDCLDKLNDLIDSVEAEREKVLGSSKGKSKNKESLERFDNRVQKHKWHMAKLELIIKLLDMDDLDPALVSGIQDSLDYYIESAVDDDGALGVEHEFDIYEDLGLESLGTAVPTFDLSRPAKDDEDSPSAAANDAPDATEAEAAPVTIKKTAATPAVTNGKGKADAVSAAKGAASAPAAKPSPKVTPVVPAAKNGAAAKANSAKAAANDDHDTAESAPVTTAAPVAAAPAGPSMSWAAHAASAVPAPAPAPAAAQPQQANPPPAAAVVSAASVSTAAPAAAAPVSAPAPAQKSPAVAPVPTPTPAAVAAAKPATASFVDVANAGAPAAVLSAAAAAEHVPSPVPSSTPSSVASPAVAAASTPPPPPPLQQQAKVNPELMVS